MWSLGTGIGWGTVGWSTAGPFEPVDAGAAHEERLEGGGYERETGRVALLGLGSGVRSRQGQDRAPG